MHDFLLRNARLPAGGDLVDIAVRDGRIAAVAPGIEGAAARAKDAAGYLVTPPFIDSHFHRDATLSLGMPRLNESGISLEGIALSGKLKPHLTQHAIVGIGRCATTIWRSARASAPWAAMWTSATSGCWRWRRCWMCKRG